MNRTPGKIVHCLIQRHGFDCSGYRPEIIAQCLNSRLAETGCGSMDEYLAFLLKHPEESAKLMRRIIINVSKFFRNALTFEYLYQRILPSIISEKAKNRDPSFRIWSAGCASGEEPYSVAIMLSELIKKENFEFKTDIFATDVDPAVLIKARDGIFSYESVKEIKYGWLKNYFTAENNAYALIPEIKKLVRFSVYDILHKKTFAPPDSIFGSFDLILCRNVLIYFQKDHQEIIMNKLFRSLAENGRLVLGKAEPLPISQQRHFYTEDEYCRIYRKIV